jgi:glycosyltransferase involved in cell wall biosynthesis
VALASYTEALPTILIEGIFALKPVLGTDTGETKSIIQDVSGCSGILLSAKPKVDEIANAIEQCMNTENYSQFQQGCAEISKKFEVSRMAEEYVKLFQN